jgi:hypothetical protein
VRELCTLALAAAPIPAAQEGGEPLPVAIKPLEWDDHNHAYTVFGPRYVVYANPYLHGVANWGFLVQTGDDRDDTCALRNG